MTVIRVITALILFASELREQLTPYVVQKVRGVPSSSCFSTRPAKAQAPTPACRAQMNVDVSRQQFIRVNFNLTFPALPCQGTHCGPQAVRVPVLRPCGAWPALGALLCCYVRVPSFHAQRHFAVLCRHAKQAYSNSVVGNVLH